MSKIDLHSVDSIVVMTMYSRNLYENMNVKRLSQLNDKTDKKDHVSIVKLGENDDY